MDFLTYRILIYNIRYHPSTADIEDPRQKDKHAVFINLKALLLYVEATVTDFLPITPSPAKSPPSNHHPRAGNAQGKQSTSECCHDCRDARLYTARRDDEHRRSSKSR